MLKRFRALRGIALKNEFWYINQTKLLLNLGLKHSIVYEDLLLTI